MFLPVDDHRCNLLVKEDEDGGEEGRDDGQYYHVPWSEESRVHQPSSTIQCRLKLTGHE